MKKVCDNHSGDIVLYENEEDKCPYCFLEKVLAIQGNRLNELEIENIELEEQLEKLKEVQNAG